MKNSVKLHFLSKFTQLIPELHFPRNSQNVNKPDQRRPTPTTVETISWCVVCASPPIRRGIYTVLLVAFQTERAADRIRAD